MSDEEAAMNELPTERPGKFPPTAVEALALFVGLDLNASRAETVASVFDEVEQALRELDEADVDEVHPAAIFDARWR